MKSIKKLGMGRVSRVNNFWLPLVKYGELGRDEPFCFWSTYNV